MTTHTDNDLACDYATRMLGGASTLALTVSAKLRDEAKHLPTLDEDDIAAFTTWAEENVPEAPRRRARITAHHIRTEWSHAVGEETPIETQEHTAERLSHLASNPAAGITALMDATTGTTPLTSTHTTLEQQLMSTQTELATTRHTHPDDRDAISELEEKVSRIRRAIDSKRVLSEAVALKGQGFIAPGSILDRLDRLTDSNEK